MVIACQWPATRRMSVIQIYRFVVSGVHSVCEVFVVILPRDIAVDRQQIRWFAITSSST